MIKLAVFVLLSVGLVSCSTSLTKQVSRSDTETLRKLSVYGYDRDFQIGFQNAEGQTLSDEGTRLWIDADSARWMSFSDYSRRSTSFTSVRSITFETDQTMNGALAGIGVGLGVGVYLTSTIGGGSDGVGAVPILLGPVVFLIPGMLIGSAITTEHEYLFTR